MRDVEQQLAKAKICERAAGSSTCEEERKALLEIARYYRPLHPTSPPLSPRPPSRG